MWQVKGDIVLLTYEKDDAHIETTYVFIEMPITRMYWYNNLGGKMMEKALVIIDIQNDMTKNYKEIIDNINRSVDWAVENHIHVVYIRHFNLSAGTRTFKPDTHGSELATDLKVVSNNVFTKSKGNVLTSEGFVDFINEHDIHEFYIVGGDAIACVKSSTYNLAKAQYQVHVLSDCITSYDKKKIAEMLQYYKDKGCHVMSLDDLLA